jgi:hypothetical protein
LVVWAANTNRASDKRLAGEDEGTMIRIDDDGVSTMITDGFCRPTGGCVRQYGPCITSPHPGMPRRNSLDGLDQNPSIPDHHWDVCRTICSLNPHQHFSVAAAESCGRIERTDYCLDSVRSQS